METYLSNLIKDTKSTFHIAVQFDAQNEKNGVVPFNLNAEANINNVIFETMFGVPNGGYIGSTDLQKKVTTSNVNFSPEEFNSLLQTSTPNLWADYIPNRSEIFIRRIERHAIARGQGFCTKTLQQLVDVSPDVKSVFFDWVTNTSARDIVVPVLEGKSGFESLDHLLGNNALVDSLLKNGFLDIHIVKMGPRDFGIRGYKSNKTSISCG